LTTERTARGAGVTEWANEFLALERTGWKGESGSALACDPATANLFRTALAGSARLGKLERLTIGLDAKPLTMLRQPEDSCAAMDHPMIGHFSRERRTIAGHNIAVGGAARRLRFRAIAAKETGSLPRGIS